MTIRFELPEAIGERAGGVDLGGKAREALLVELYREERISHRQLGEALGLEAYDTDGVLKRYGVGLGISLEELRGEGELLKGVRPG